MNTALTGIIQATSVAMEYTVSPMSGLTMAAGPPLTLPIQVILAVFSCQNMTTTSIVPRKARLHTRTMTLYSQDPFDAKQTGRRVFPFFHSPFPVLSYPFAGRAIIPNQKAGISARFPHNYLNFLLRAASDFFLRFTEGFS